MPLSPTPFQRLRVSDGLLITADHWQQAHAYGRSRQNFHYQALHQGGIVSGLGIRVLEVPPTPDGPQGGGQRSDGRQLLIQPGIAIDAQGNPIILSEPMTFPIQAEVAGGESLEVYVVVNYVDPDDLNLGEEWVYVQETLRVREKTELAELDVELCRLVLQADEDGQVRLRLPTRVSLDSPGPNVVDLRFRQWVRARPQALLRVAAIAPSDLESQETSGEAPRHPEANLVLRGLGYLLDAVEPLYPSLRGDGVVPLQPQDLGAVDLNPYTLIHSEDITLLQLTDLQRRSLRHYLRQGGVLFVTASLQDPRLQTLMRSAQDLRQALLLQTQETPDRAPDQQPEPEPDPLQTLTARLHHELSATEATIERSLQTILSRLQPLGSSLGLDLTQPSHLTLDHPLHRHPYLFSQWPDLNGIPLQLFAWDGLILCLGAIHHTWGLAPPLNPSRETLRSSQELGINLLHYSWQRRQWEV